MASSNSEIYEPERGCPKRAELLDMNINTGVQNINTEKASVLTLPLHVFLSKLNIKIAKT